MELSFGFHYDAVSAGFSMTEGLNYITWSAFIPLSAHYIKSNEKNATDLWFFIFLETNLWGTHMELISRDPLGSDCLSLPGMIYTVWGI